MFALQPHDPLSCYFHSFISPKYAAALLPHCVLQPSHRHLNFPAFACHCCGAGQWIRLLHWQPDHYRIPLSHPLSICYTSPSSFTVLFRGSGSLGLLGNSHPARCIVEGYHGPANRREVCMQHCRLVLVAGGIGITPMLHLLQSVCASNMSRGKLRSVEMVWACKDTALIEYICPVLRKIVDGCSDELLDISVRIHRTGIAAAVGSASADYLDTALHKEPEVVEVKDKARTTPFMPSAFSVQDMSSGRRAALVLCYAVCLSFSAIVSVSLVKQTEDKHQTWARLYALLFVCLGVALLCPCFVVLARALQRQESHQGLDEAKEATSTRDEEVVQHMQLTSFKQEAVERVQMHLGRPDLAFLHSCQDTVVSACGPKELLRVAKEFTAGSCSRNVRAGIVFYEEVFEW